MLTGEKEIKTQEEFVDLIYEVLYEYRTTESVAELCNANKGYLQKVINGIYKDRRPEKKDLDPIPEESKESSMMILD